MNQAPLLEAVSRVDNRGALRVIEQGNGMAFSPKRVFWVEAVPVGEIRGMHAHRDCQQILICIAGSILVTLDDGSKRTQVLLDSSSKVLFMDRNVWGEQQFLEPDSKLLVLASHPYEEKDYIRDYDEFATYVSGLVQQGT